MARRMNFNRWIEILREDVIQGEYGYEEGEFTVYPEHWRGMWLARLTPSEAFKRALYAKAGQVPPAKAGVK